MVKNKSIDWKITTNRFVVFLDIMGFKDFVLRNTHEEVYSLMTKLSNAVEKISRLDSTSISLGYHGKELYATNFSDSIIIFSKDDTHQSFALIVASAKYIMAEAIKESIPIKGALAHGIISVNTSQRIYFGQPLIDAYLLQEDLNYYGVIFHNSADKYIETIEDNIVTEGTSFSEIYTPLKSGKIKHINLNWFGILGFETDESNKSIFDSSIKKLKTITSGAPRKYIDNTEEVFKLFYPQN